MLMYTNTHLMRKDGPTAWQHLELNKGSQPLKGGSAPKMWPFHALVQNIHIISPKEAYVLLISSPAHTDLGMKIKQYAFLVVNKSLFFMRAYNHQSKSPAMTQAEWYNSSRPGFRLVLTLVFYTGLFQITPLAIFHSLIYWFSRCHLC